MKSYKDLICLLLLTISTLSIASFVICGFMSELHFVGIMSLIIAICSYTSLVIFVKNN